MAFPWHQRACKAPMLTFVAPTALRASLPCSLFQSTHVTPHIVTPARPTAMPMVFARMMKTVPAIMRPVVPSRELFEINVEDKAQPRNAIIKSIAQYAKANNLQDPKDGRIVHCDVNLQRLFGVPKCTYFEMGKFITPYIKKPEEVGQPYVEQARVFEETYLRQKALEYANAPEKPKKKRRRRSPEEAEKQTARVYKLVRLSDDLHAICGQREMPRPLILKAIWDYIRANNLHVGPGQPIICDERLKKIYNREQIDVRSVMKGISLHVQKIE